MNKHLMEDLIQYMSKQQSIKSNYIYNTFFQIATLLVPFITTPYVARVLGADGVGQYSMAFSVVTYFTLFANLGSALYGKRTIAIVRDNPQKLSDTFWNIFLFRLISTSVCAFAYYGLMVISNSKSPLGYIVGLNILNVVLDFSWFFSGIERFKLLSIKNFFVRVINCVCIYLFIKSKNDVPLYAALLVGFTMLGNISLVINLRPYITRPKVIKPFEGIKEILLIFLPTIAAEVYTVLDKSMIGWITESNYANGCYEQSEKIARVALTIVTSVGAVVLPRVANLYHNNDEEHAKTYVYKSYRVTWMLSIPMMFGIIAIAPILVPVFLGNGYDDSIPLLMVFSLLIPFVGSAYTTGHSYLMATKQQNIYTMSITVAAIANLVMNLILIPRYSALGAAIASVTVEGLGATIQIMYCIRTKQLSCNNIFKGIWKYITAGIGMLLTVIGVRHILGVNALSLIALIGIGIFVYAAILIILTDDFFTDNVKSVIRNFRTRR